jgi:BirA family biotin operon repressor/biotin-[acetyl-CoA-carboxylase] ligase
MDFCKLCAIVDERLVGVTVKSFDEIDSTNTEAKRCAAQLRCGQPTLFIARRQSAGRGRMGRDFISRADCGIYMSLLYFCEDELRDVISVTTFAAYAVATSIERSTKKQMRIKWVNDVYDGRGKVSGILVETIKADARLGVVVGIGINVGDVDFPDEISTVASSIGEVDTHKAADIIVDAVTKLLEYSKDHTDRSFMNEYRSRLMMVGEQVTLTADGEQVMSGTMLGVDDDGGLLIATSESETSAPVTVRRGEVSLRKSMI